MTKKNDYKIELELINGTFKSSGKTLSEAFENLGLTWNEIKSKGMMKVTKGDMYIEKLFMMHILRRIMSNKLVRQTWDKNLNFLMKPASHDE